ncbi:helix-turn-helix transcriptional regulator [Akkermansiaceae bacterium]|nr:helix-turn-helix transcriptional regulator [Akkermansiaceae bacterium]
MPRKSEPALKNGIRELREQKVGMTQQDFAEQIGVTRQTIVALEKGTYSPSLALALRIAALFEQPVEEIFWIEE